MNKVFAVGVGPGSPKYVTDIVKDKSLVQDPLDVTDIVKQNIKHPFPIPEDQLEKIKANSDLIQFPEGQDVPLPPGGVDKGNFFTRLKENYRQKQLDKDLQGSRAMWDERKEEIYDKKEKTKS